MIRLPHISDLFALSLCSPTSWGDYRRGETFIKSSTSRDACLSVRAKLSCRGSSFGRHIDEYGAWYNEKLRCRAFSKPCFTPSDLGYIQLWKIMQDYRYLIYLWTVQSTSWTKFLSVTIFFRDCNFQSYITLSITIEYYTFFDNLKFILSL